MDKKQRALDAHKQWQGKIEVVSRAEVNDGNQLSVAYTPGVAEPCLEISGNTDLSYTYTRRGNLVAVVTDGSAVLGLGDIGPEAGMPVMEGKCVLFKTFAGVDAFPLCIRSHDVDTIVETVRLLAGSFGGINLEDISAPRCFEIERRLKESCDIPVFHDDQHGTAIVSLAGVLSACRLTGRSLADTRMVINGAGSAGIAIADLMMKAGARDIILCDSKGIISPETAGSNADKLRMCITTNPRNVTGGLADAIAGADIFLGVSAPGVVKQDMVRSMARDAIVFAMANPVPEIMPDEARACGARVIGTGRSDFPNQINNVLAFPGIFRGALDVRAGDINEPMKLAAAYALSALVGDDVREDYVIPAVFDKRVAPAVAAAVAQAAKESGVARI